jgi:crotonobetainyl-CoA:carnitine CoA-transferase CaiB-like acyl-CoA transferase
MVDAILAVSERIVHQQSFGKIIAQPEGNHHPFITPFGIFPASDGHVAIACPSDKFFVDLCAALEAPELAKQAGFSTADARRRNRQSVIDAVGAQSAKLSKAELKTRLGGKIPFAPVYAMSEISTDPHFASRNMLAEIDCPPIKETMRIAGVPLKFSDTPGGVFSRAPHPGEHTDEVLLEAGFTAEDIKVWRDMQAIG